MTIGGWRSCLGFNWQSAIGNRQSGSHGVPGEQAAEVVIAARRLDVEQQRVGAHTHFRAENRLHSGLRGRLHKLDRTVKVPGIGQRHCGHVVLFRQPHERAHGWATLVGESVESRNELWLCARKGT